MAATSDSFVPLSDEMWSVLRVSRVRPTPPTTRPLYRMAFAMVQALLVSQLQHCDSFL